MCQVGKSFEESSCWMFFRRIILPIANDFVWLNGPAAGQSQLDQIPGIRNVYRISSKSSFQTSLQKQMFPFRNVKRFQKLIWLFSGKILQAWAYFNSHNIARLSTLRNCTLLIRLPGTVSNGLNAQKLKIFTKVQLKGSLKLLKSIRIW